ncbi:MAG: ATP-binding protein [bacterium]
MPSPFAAFVKRNLTARVLEALRDNPVVVLHGARQTGKSTLVQHLAAGPHPAEYITMDDAVTLAAARSDPAGFVVALPTPVVIDEVQRVPELFLAIKANVDRDRRPGRFLLTGSANILLIPRLSESLAGRMELLTLYPLSQGEIEGVREAFIDRVFSDEAFPVAREETDREDVRHRVLKGGYPEALSRAPKRRGAWFGSYLTTILQRDVRDLQEIERLTELPRLLSILSARTGTLLNVADLSRSSGIPQRTLARYLTLLQATFLMRLVPAWTASVRRRLLKSPKILAVDTGLASYLLGLDAAGLARMPDLYGQLLETFVCGEIEKQMAWSEVNPRSHQFRTAEGDEVDLVLESPSGKLVGVEVKAAASIGDGDFKGLRTLRALAGRKFHRGILLYGGNMVVPFGEGFTALPVTSVWKRRSR